VCVRACVCVGVCVDSKFEINDLCPRYLPHWFNITKVKFELKGHRSKFKVTGGKMLLQWLVQARGGFLVDCPSQCLTKYNARHTMD